MQMNAKRNREAVLVVNFDTPAVPSVGPYNPGIIGATSTMGEPIRVGAVNYLNTKPLIESFEAIASEAALSLEVPSKLADQLAGGKLDVGLIPVIEYFRAGTYSIVPGISIASRGPVLSVTLFSRVPWPEVRSVALDEGSRTSAALARILFEQRNGVRPQTVQLPMGVA